VSEFKEAGRQLTSLTAVHEKRLLLWLAARIPTRIGPDHLTALGFIGILVSALAYWRSGENRLWLHVVNLGLVVNWFGDSLDGTLARHRNRLRPRYGFYVDHMVDAFGVLALLAGLGASGLMRPWTASGLLIVYFLLQIEIYLATYSLGTFKISFGPFGGTELRLLLILGNLSVLRWPTAFGMRLYDVAGIFGIVGLAITVLAATIRNTRRLYEEERLP
jgi:archaetidylinositol phosphate synthase